MFNRMLRMALVCTATLALAVGCGDNDDKNNNAGNNTTANNTSPNNTTPNNTTPNNTTPNNVNNNPTEQCSSVGEDCVIGDPTAATFSCVDLGDGPKCRSLCTQAQTPQDPKGCPAGSICVAAEEGGPTICQPSQCSGWDDATSCDTFFPNTGGNCFPDELFFDQQAAELIPNGAFLCAESGGAAEGDTCSSLNDCAPGLLCDGGTCKTICGADGDCSLEGDSCVGEESPNFLDNNIGLCDVACDPFSTGQCPTGLGCVAISENEGVCVEVGTGALGDQCELGTEMNPADPQCSEGLQCVNFGEEDGSGNQFGRCVATCSTLGVNQDAWNDTCPTGDQNAFGRFVHLDETKTAVDIYVNDTRVVDDLAFGETSMNGMFAQVPVGQLTVDIVAGTDADNTSPLLTVTPTTTANDSITWGITPDGADIQVIAIDVPRNEAAPASGSSKFRVAHGIPDVTPVDVVAVPANDADFTNEVVLAANLAFGDAGAFLEAPAATYDVYVFNAGATRTVGAEAAVFDGVVIPADETFTVYARGAAANTNLGLTIVDYASANVSSALPQFCFELTDTPSATGGICFDTCTADQYGDGVCGISDFQCNPFGPLETHLCFPGGDVPVGGACDPDADDCDELGTCEGRGDGTGVCVSLCQPTNETNPALGCGTNETCNPGANPDSFNFGQCGTACSPTAGALTDASCPANLQNCFVNDTDQTEYFCSASGDTALGGNCDVISGGAFATNTCEGGALCANELRLGSDNMGASAEDPGTCTTICELVSEDDSACAAGAQCGLDWINAGTGLGFCTDTGDNSETAVQGDACTTQGAPCGDGSVCLNTGGGLACLYFCDRNGSNDSCAAGSTCEDAFQLGTQLDIGLCL